ncbi:MAG: hypothetical protein KDE09_17380, partial [Anaerolineales bacterium]|nr:hypothetical protein [Anaerolineales bacterium]
MSLAIVGGTLVRLIGTSDLKSWAGTKAAESRFPGIVKSLISAVVHPAKLRMPSGDSVWLPGFDGEVVNSEHSLFVPQGMSVWELGTDTSYKSKATRDFKKRSFNSDGSPRNTLSAQDRLERTFVFVTPLVWRDKAEWISDRKAQGVWKDIWVIDGAALVDWIEVAPAVQLAFAAELGLAPGSGLQTLEQAWEEWSNLTEPPISRELVVVGREAQRKELVDRILEAPSTFIVRGTSLREAWGFALACITGIESE